MEMKENPWQVDDLQAFSFLCCPECVYRSQEETSFQVHAIQNHPQSSVFFSNGNIDPLNIKEEVVEDYAENGEFEASENVIHGTFGHCINLSEEPKQIQRSGRKQTFLIREEITTNLKQEVHIKESPIEDDINCLECPKCFKTLGSKRNLEQHIAIVHEGLKPFKCDLCGESFVTKRSQVKHVRIVHDRSFECPKCLKTFYSKRDMNIHVDTVHERKKPFKRDHCEKSFCSNLKHEKHVGAVSYTHLTLPTIYSV